MTEIKKGDWVYFPFTGGTEHVFKCTGLRHDIGCISSEEAGYDKSNCYRLTPLEPLENVERGTRCAVIVNHHVFSAGDIVQWDDVSLDQAPFVKNKNYRSAARRDKLARMPDCAQGGNHTDADKAHRCDSGESATSQKKCHMGNEVPHEPKPTPCPHPEWEGVWLYCGEAHRIEWNGTGFMAHEINTPDMDVFCLCPDTEWYSDGPTPRWTQLEAAPTASTAGPKLSRPPRHGGVTVPWDPYGEG